MNILVLIHSAYRMWTIPARYVERLRVDFPEHAFAHARDDAEGITMIRDADAAFSAQITHDLLQASSRLRWIHSPAAGTGRLLHPAMLAHPAVITNSRGTSAETIGEHVVGVVLALFRRLPLAYARQQQRTWAQEEIGAPPGNRLVAGSHVVIVGAGSIGSAAAVRLRALGASVTGIRRRPQAGAPPGMDEIRGPDDLAAVLPAADAVVIAAPQTRETRGLFGARQFSLMQPGAVFVNVSRGGLVDEAALAEALRRGHLGGAALDVVQHEPLDPGSPLWDLPNLLITPHTSGFRRDHWDVVTGLFAENLRRFERGEPLLNLVDKQAGY